MLTEKQADFLDRLAEGGGEGLYLARPIWEGHYGGQWTDAMKSAHAAMMKRRDDLLKNADPIDPSASGRPVQSTHDWIMRRNQR